MRQSLQEMSARRFSVNEFDVVIPDQVLEEMRRRYSPKPAPPPPPVQPPPVNREQLPLPQAKKRIDWSLAGWIAALVLMFIGICALVMTYKPEPNSAARATIEKIIANAGTTPMPTPTSTHRTLNPWLQAPAPTPTPTPARSQPQSDYLLSQPQQQFTSPPAPQPRPQPQPRVRRARPVMTPAPRAELVSIPFGARYLMDMPYGEEIVGTFSGYVPTLDDLPSIGVPYEFYVARDTNIAWVWVPWVRGGQGAWIDP